MAGEMLRVSGVGTFVDLSLISGQFVITDSGQCVVIQSGTPVW